MEETDHATILQAQLERKGLHMPSHLKVALVHYWLVRMRGGERVLEALCELFPHADIFTIVANPDELSPAISKHKITTSFIQKIGGAKHYKKMLPLMPFALESFDLTPYDLVISSEAGPAKAVVTRPDAVHICYCHSPMRYIWDLYPQYQAQAGRLARIAMALTAPLLRIWDVTSAERVDYFVANSAYVAKRIKKFYGRSASVIHPPIDASRFAICEDGPEEYYICAGQITPYKRIDLAIEAFNQLRKPLVVIGAGVTPELRKMAGPTIRFLGAVDDEAIAHYFARCRALIFPGVEDFGMVPLEVMACGRPVIAFARGGALETVADGKTGILFGEQDSTSIANAVQLYEMNAAQYVPCELRKHAMNFHKSVFDCRMREFILSTLETHKRQDQVASKEKG